jgi:penicillin amidase
VANWRWDRVNSAEFRHMPFDNIFWLRRWFSRTVPRGGDAFTVTPVMPIRGRTFISSYRQIIDLASIDASKFIIPMGQSGHVWSGHYADLLDKWNKTEYLPMRFSRSAVDEAAGDRLVLEPR